MKMNVMAAKARRSFWRWMRVIRRPSFSSAVAVESSYKGEEVLLCSEFDENISATSSALNFFLLKLFAFVSLIVALLQSSKLLLSLLLV